MLEMLDDSQRVDSLSELWHLVSVTLVGALHLERAFVWYRDPRERIASAASSDALPPPDFPARERWLSWLEQRGAMRDDALVVVADECNAFHRRRSLTSATMRYGARKAKRTSLRGRMTKAGRRFRRPTPTRARVVP